MHAQSRFNNSYWCRSDKIIILMSPNHKNGMMHAWTNIEYRYYAKPYKISIPTIFNLMHCFVALAIKYSMLKGMCVGGGRAHEIIWQTYSPLQSIWLCNYQVTAQMGSGRLGE